MSLYYIYIQAPKLKEKKLFGFPIVPIITKINHE